MTHPTANQVVAFNLARLRQARGLTQEEFGTLLARLTGKPWSKATVSAAERSRDGKRTRQFDADDLTAIGGALGVTVAELLRRPPATGPDQRYIDAALAVDPIDEEAARLAELPGFRRLIDELERLRNGEQP